MVFQLGGDIKARYFPYLAAGTKFLIFKKNCLDGGMAVYAVRNFVRKVEEFQWNSPSGPNQNNEYAKKAVFVWFYQA